MDHITQLKMNVMGYSGHDVALVSLHVGDVHAKFHADQSMFTTPHNIDFLQVCTLYKHSC